MSFDTQRLIREIQIRPCIWKLWSEDYSNRVLKQRNWNEIAEFLYGDWQNLEKNTKQKRIQDLQKKWKGLRDYHAREKNKDSLKSRSGAPKKRNAPYLDMLHFLNVSKTSNQTSGNITAGTSSNSSAMFDENDSTNSVVNVSTLKNMTAFQAALLKKMEKKRENDPDMNFLLNILPEMKTMSPAQNFEFRFEVMKLIKNIKYNEYNNCSGGLMQTGGTNASDYPHQDGYAAGSSTPNVQDYPSTSNNYNAVGSNSIPSPRNSPSHSSTGSSVEVKDIEAILGDNSYYIEEDE